MAKKAGATKPTATTPLAGRAPVELPRFAMSERPFFNKIILRGKGDDEAFVAATTAALGVAPPEPNQTVAVGGGDDELLLWLAPDEFMLWTPRGEERLRALNFGDAHAVAVDVSDYYTVVRVSGELAEKTLAHGCPLDLPQMPAGACAQSRFRNAAVLLRKSGGGKAPVYDAQVRWSFAAYFWSYLAQTASVAENTF